MVCYQLVTVFEENLAGSQLCGKFSEKLHRDALSMSFLIHQSLSHRAFFSPTLRPESSLTQLVTGAAVAPGMIIMVEAVTTAWLLTPRQPETIGSNKRWGKGA